MNLKIVNHLNTKYLVLISMLLIAAYMLFRNYGVYPSVVDEYTYSNSSRLLSIGDPSTANYLYKIVYRFTNICGAGWLECAKLINIVFYTSSIPIIYFIAKKFTSEKKAILVALLSILGPISTYTAYFMPESMYFFFFWILMLALSGADSMINGVKIFLIATILGLLSLIKPHAFFLVIPIFIFGIYINYIKNKKIIYWFLKFIIIFILGIACTKFLIAFYFSGKEGLSFFGPGYNGVGKFIFSFAFENIKNLVKVTEVLSRQIIGHFMALSIIFGPLICISINTILSKGLTLRPDLENSNKSIQGSDFVVLALTMIFCMTFVSAFFTAGMGVQIEPEAYRLHMRYYNFLLPLILISGVIEGGGTSRQRVLIATPFICVVAYAIFTNYSILIPNYVDGPEMRGLHANKYFFYINSIACIAILFLWIKRPRLAFYLFIYFLYPLFLVVSNYNVNIELRNRMHLSPYDRAAIFAAQYLPKSETSSMVMVGSPASLGILALSQIYINNPNVAVVTVPEGEVINREKLGRDYKWIISSGNYSMGLPSKFGMSFDGFQVNRIDSDIETIDFSSDRWPGYIDYIKGLGPAEPWGRWSRGKTVEIKFLYPLPAKFTLSIEASPYGENLNKKFLVRVGNEEKSFTLSKNNQEVEIDFNNPSNSRLLRVDIPVPASDEGPLRGLGFGLIKMRIQDMSHR